MNKYKTLISNTALISLGTIGSKLLVFFMVRFYTGYLTTAEFGTADIITQTCNLLLPIISLGISNGVFRFAIDSNHDKKSVFSSGLYTITLGGLLFLIIAPLLAISQQMRSYLWLIIIYTMASCYHSLCAQFIRAKNKTAFFAVQGIVNTSLVIAFNILFLAVFDWGIIGYVLSVALADGLTALLIFFKEKLWREIILKPEKSTLKQMLSYSIPMIPATIFWWVTSVSDRYMVTWFLGEAENGIYAVSNKLPTVLTLISTVFMQAWQFSAISESENDKQEHIEFYSKVWSSFQSVMFLAGSAITALSVPLIKILTTESFYSAWKFVPMLSLAMIFSAFANFMGSVYVVEKRSKNSFLTTMVGAGVNIILNFILIPKIGSQGAAIATFASYLAVFIIRTFDAKKYIPFKTHFVTVSINCLIVLLQIGYMLFGLPFNYPVQAVCFIALFVINFRFFKVFFEKILSFVKRRR
ncbi:MAG: hypothetical protein E7545_05250 [Ruminococcaceae bacterium]|nr:hypothetical protein [Oscillospiraceae bacterium]